MMQRIFSFVVVLFLVGCANMTPMALNKKTQSIDVKSKSIVLMSLELARSEASRYIPNPAWAEFTKIDGSGKTVRQLFTIDADAGKATSEVHNKFLLRFALEPGKYEMRTVFGNANAFPFIATFEMPLLIEVDVPAESVIYMGRVNALMRPRVGNEFRAGSVVPLIDQAAAGISNSTFDITVIDASIEEIPEFKATFPSLATAQIQTKLLPQFDRSKVQAWWANNGKHPAPAPAAAPAVADNTKTVMQ